MSEAKPSSKAAARAHYRAANQRATAVERAGASSRLCAQIRETKLWQTSQNIMLFAPLPDEPDIYPLIDEAIQKRKTLVLPRYDESNNRYVPARIENPEHDLAVGKFGAREPTAGCSPHPLNQLDLILVPGVAFDAYGFRLGRGKGYYDQMLSQTAGIKLGLAFDWQIDTRLPAEPHDIKMDCILTPTRWVKTLASARF